MRARGWKGAATACAAALLMAGCGSAEEERERESDDARAKAALIAREDLTADWSPLAATDVETLPSRRELAQMCPGYPADWLSAEEADADASFESEAASLTHGITVEEDAARAREAFDDFESGRARSCMTGILEWSMRAASAEQPDAGIELGEITAAPLRLADGLRGMRIEIELSAGGGEVELPAQADVVVDERDGAFSMLMLTAIGAPVDEALRDRLAAVASERLDEQFG